MAAVEEPTTQVRAEARWVRTAPRKAQLVVREIRGRTVADARTTLAFMARGAARDVEKVLKSAVANAETNHGLSDDELYVSAAFVGEGPTLKRWQARARGRVGRIRKRTCHITILVAPIPEAAGPQVAVEEEKPRTTRRRKSEAAPTPAMTEAAVEKKPKRTRKPTAAAAEPVAEAPAAEEVPEPAAAEPAAEAPTVEDVPETEVAGVEQPAVAAKPPVEEAAPEEPAAEAPKPRRTRAKKAETEGAAEPASPEPEAEEKPTPARRRKKADDESGEGS
jgi:large subunit ribosomal protein L22